MATSLLFKISDQSSNHDDHQNMKMRPLCEETNNGSSSEPGRSSRGRKANGKGPKKQPQRGMGVAKLERLRAHESLMKMNIETWGVPTFIPDHIPMLPFTTVQDPFISSSSSTSVLPVRYGGAAAAGSNHVHGVVQCHQQVINGNAIAVWGQGPNFIGNSRSGGLNNVVATSRGVGACSGMCGVGLVPNQQLNRVSSYGSGAPLWTPLVDSPLETSKELSSMPNVHFEPQCFDICLKKSRFNEVNVKGSNARNYMPYEICPNGPDFLGLIPQPAAPNYLIGETSDFYNKLVRHDAAAAIATTNLDECVEVVAVHRRENSVSGRVFMEYEFFPGKDGTASKGLELSTNIGSVAVGGEASPIPATAYYGDTASNSIDLSLKLSH